MWTSYLPAGTMTLGAVLAFAAGTPKAVPLVRPIAEASPAVFLGSPGKDVALSDDEQLSSGVTGYLNRSYDVGGVRPVLLYVGYHATQQGNHRMHSPSLCLPGAGWTPIESRTMTLSLGDSSVHVNRYVLQKDRYRMLVYYWFQGRGRVTAGEAQLKVRSMLDALLTHRDEEALVRVIVPVDASGEHTPIGSTGMVADTIATRMASAVIPALQRVLPPAL